MSVDVMNTVSSYRIGCGSQLVTSAVSTRSDTSSRAKRPKSTPASCLRPGAYTPNHGDVGMTGKMNRPKTAAAVLGFSKGECDRVIQLEHEPTRRHNLEAHMPLKKSKPPPWQKNLEQPLVPFVVGPGYILSRSKSKFAVTLKEEFFEPVQEEDVKPMIAEYISRSTSPLHPPRSVSAPTGTKRKKQVDSERDNIINQLQSQISDLTLYLEEERLNHRQTKQKAEEFLKDKVDELQTQHRDRIRDLQDEHEEQLENVQKSMELEHNQYKSNTEAQISRMKKEIEFLQGAFESYKSSLHQEMDDKWKRKQTDLTQELEQQKNAAIHEMKTKFVQEKNADKAQTAKDHHRQIDNIRKEHKRELDAVIRRYSNVASDLERLTKTTAELEETRMELEIVKQRYEETCQQLANVTRELTDTKLRLLSFEEQFDAKVQEVDEKYKKRINELMTQNTELKRLYVEKCGELFEEKVLFEKDRQERVMTAKETMQSMLQSKHKADVAFTPGDEQLEEKTRKSKKRPGSAPVTKGETEVAHLSAGEVEVVSHEGDELIRPNVILPEDSEEVKELRKQLLEDVREMSKEELLRTLEEQDG